MPRPTLFVTGMQRSGTTLLGRLLDAHPGISLLSQPFPYLYLDAKREFLRHLGLEPGPYPLGPLFDDPAHRPVELEAFLRSYRPSRDALLATFQAMRGWSGQRTDIPPALAARVLDRPGRDRTGPSPEGFAGLVVELVHGFARELLSGGTGDWRGSKEIHCEELLPHLLDQGVRCLVVVRDPRDVIASLNHGDGGVYGGRIKPTLFNVRNWRKSVAFAHHLEDRVGFRWLRYEDLTARPRETLAALCEWLGLPPIPPERFDPEGTGGPAGGRWAGNSSHGERRGVSTASVGIWRRVLPRHAVRRIEAACWPELRSLGYPVALGRDQVREVLEGYVEPYDGTRPELAAYTAPACANAEVERLERLDRPAGRSSRRWFLFERAHERLRAAVEGPASDAGAAGSEPVSVPDR